MKPANRLHPIVLLTAWLPFFSFGQTVGLQLNTPGAFDGYTLVAPTGATRTHLIDNCGRIINEWVSEYRAGESAYLLEDGSLLRTCRLSSDIFNGGGIGGRIERFDWSGDLVWSVNIADSSRHHHHDMTLLPNGHLVLLAWEYKSPEEVAAVGRVAEGELWPPVLIEIDPAGAEGGDIVWEWHAWDHLVQNVNPNLDNFGEPSEFWQRFDVNHIQNVSGGFPGGGSGGDWFHCNAVTHHPGRDQLMLNSRNWNEFYIIDHNTTSAEAAGPAGDLLYRWGNPAAYGRGEASDRLLFQQHDPHWLLDEGPATSGGDPNNTVLLFNNGNGRPGGNGSTVDELTLPWDAATGTYATPTPGGTDAFLPAALDWSWPENIGPDFFSPNISGAQRLPNGNTLICEGNQGHLFEIDANGETAWEYTTAYNQFGAIDQFDSPFGNSTFRAYRYSPDFPGLEGVDLTPGPVVEGNPLPFDCELHPDTTASTGIRETVRLAASLYPNPSAGVLNVHSPCSGRWTVRSVQGQKVGEGLLLAPMHTITLNGLPSGMYFLTIESKEDSGRQTLPFILTPNP